MECEMITLSKLGMKESNDLLLDVSRWEKYQLLYISGISAISTARCHQLTWRHVSSGSRTSSMIRSLQSVSLSTALFIQLWWYDLAIRLGRGAQLLRRKAVLVLFCLTGRLYLTADGDGSGDELLLVLVNCCG